MMAMRWLLLIPMVFAGLPVLAHEPQVETLHVTSSLVEVSAVVTNKRGEPQAGLTRDDFILKQDGKEQAIRYFSQGDELPLTFLVMIDTSGSQRTFLDDEQRACDVFFETVLGRPQDHAALIEVNANIVAHSDLTNDPNKLHLALSALHYDQTAATATRLNDAIFTLSKSVLSKIRGRKAIILISDGGDNGSATKNRDAIAEAQRDNVPIYSVSYSAWGGFQPSQTGHGYSVGAGRDLGMDNLKEWSSATGGRVYQVTAGSTLKHIFENIAAELRVQYELGYSLPADSKPNEFHKLDLKTRDKGLQVQARKGFYTNP